MGDTSDLLSGGLRDYTRRRISHMERMLQVAPQGERAALRVKIDRAVGALRLCHVRVIEALRAEAWAHRLDKGGICTQVTNGTLQYHIIRWDTGRPILHIADWNTVKGRALRAELLRQPRRPDGGVVIVERCVALAQGGG